MLVESQLFLSDSEVFVPLHPHFHPTRKPLVVVSRLHKELHLSLLKFPSPKDKIPRRDLVSERFSNLCDAERNPLPSSTLNIQKIHEDPLGRLRADVHCRRRVLHRTHKRLEHKVEHPRLCERIFLASLGTALLLLPEGRLESGDDSSYIR